MNKVFKIIIQFKKLDQNIQKKLGQNPEQKGTGLIDFGLPCTLDVNSNASDSAF